MSKIKPHKPINKCEHCNWPYPSGLLNAMRTNDSQFDGKYVCGICYLDISNMIHKIQRVKLDGEVAEQFRQSAIKWREKHPYDKPKEVKNEP